MNHVDKKLYRSSRPKDLNKTKADDMEVIISLEMGIYQLVTDTKREHQFPVDFGIDYYDLNCSILTPPESWQIEKFLEIVDRGKKTLVHCLTGVDRTGFMCAVYRMHRQGWTLAQAHDEWIKMGRHFMYVGWNRELKKYARR